MSLTPKQQRFVEEYLVDCNASGAARRAGYSVRTAEWQGPQLLGKTHVAAAIAAARAKLSERTEITQERVLLEYARLAFIDPRKLFDADGKPLPITSLDDATAAAIVGLDVASVGNADIGVGEVLKVKLADKKGALDSIARHLGMFEADNRQKGDVRVKVSASDMSDDELSAIARSRKNGPADA